MKNGSRRGTNDRSETAVRGTARDQDSHRGAGSRNGRDDGARRALYAPGSPARRRDHGLCGHAWSLCDRVEPGGRSRDHYDRIENEFLRSGADWDNSDRRINAAASRETDDGVADADHIPRGPAASDGYPNAASACAHYRWLMLAVRRHAAQSLFT